jgi:predicted transcriptional regulator
LAFGRRCGPGSARIDDPEPEGYDVMMVTKSISLDDKTNATLELLATKQGRTIEAILEATARELASYGADFLAEVERGKSDADSGRFVTADQIRADVKRRLDGLGR